MTLQLGVGPRDGRHNPVAKTIKVAASGILGRSLRDVGHFFAGTAIKNIKKWFIRFNDLNSLHHTSFKKGVQNVKNDSTYSQVKRPYGKIT